MPHDRVGGVGGYRREVACQIARPTARLATTKNRERGGQVGRADCVGACRPEAIVGRTRRQALRARGRGRALTGDRGATWRSLDKGAGGEWWAATAPIAIRHQSKSSKNARHVLLSLVAAPASRITYPDEPALEEPPFKRRE